MAVPGSGILPPSGAHGSPAGDEEPYTAPKEKMHKVLRLEGEASDRMWRILLNDDEFNKTEQEVEKTEFEATKEYVMMDSANDIADDMLKLHLSDSWMDENGRLQHGKVWVDTKGPAKHGWKKMEPKTTVLPPDRQQT